MPRSPARGVGRTSLSRDRWFYESSENCVAREGKMAAVTVVSTWETLMEVIMMTILMMTWFDGQDRSLCKLGRRQVHPMRLLSDPVFGCGL